jgi:hypothetical protein
LAFAIGVTGAGFLATGSTAAGWGDGMARGGSAGVAAAPCGTGNAFATLCNQPTNPAIFGSSR